MRRLAVLAAASVVLTFPTGATSGASAPFAPAGVSFVSSSLGWELGGLGCGACAVVRVTTDGGRSWKLRARLVPGIFWANARRTHSVSDIAFANAHDGYVFGRSLYSTHDGGETWGRQRLSAVNALQVGGGYAFALTGADPVRDGVEDLWRSPVARDQWRLVAQFAAPDGAELAVDGTVVAVLQGGSVSGTATTALWVSRTSWARWQRYDAPCHAETQGAQAIGLTHGDPNRWFVDCFDNRQSSQAQHTEHHLYETANAGHTWRRLADPSHNGLPALLAATSDAIVLTTESGGSDELHASFDGGRSFRVLFRSGGSFFGWGDLAFLDSRTGFVVGPTHYAPEHVYRTDDEGRHWRIIDSA